MISLAECTEILNQTKGKRKFKDGEVRQIREILNRLAELEYQEFINQKILNDKSKQKDEGSNICSHQDHQTV